MDSNIYAVANIATFKLYVGNTHVMKTRWPGIIEKLSQGTLPHPGLQAAWKQFGDQRKFTFHTRKDIESMTDVLGLDHFHRDVEYVIPDVQEGKGDSHLYAVVDIAGLHLYVGHTQLMRERWPIMLDRLNAGTFPNTAIQKVWMKAGGQRHFTFHTCKDVAAMTDLVGLDLFLKDVQNS